MPCPYEIMNTTQQRISLITFILLAGFGELLTDLDQTRNLDEALAILRDPTTAVLQVGSTQAEALADTLDAPRDLQTAADQIEALQAENERLAREVEELREIEGEYQLLLDLFNRARQSAGFTRLTASVIGQDTNPALRSIIIDKGFEDGVQVGMPVEGARGLVGQVFRTTANSAQVVLITDSASAIPGRLGSSRATGSLRGGGLGGTLTIDWIDLNFQVQVGEVVRTSGLGGKFPQDIVIGRVTEVERSEADLFQQATVQSAVSFDSLEIVFVITDFQPVDLEIFSEPPGN